MSKVRDILGPDKESEFLQSFVRVGFAAEEDEEEPHKSVYVQPKPDLSSDLKLDIGEKSPRRLR